MRGLACVLAICMMTATSSTMANDWTVPGGVVPETPESTAEEIERCSAAQHEPFEYCMRVAHGLTAQEFAALGEGCQSIRDAKTQHTCGDAVELLAPQMRPSPQASLPVLNGRQMSAIDSGCSELTTQPDSARCKSGVSKINRRSVALY